jgi:hypothetical protein
MAQLTAVIIIDLFREGGVERDSGVGCDHEGVLGGGRLRVNAWTSNLDSYRRKHSEPTLLTEYFLKLLSSPSVLFSATESL